MSTPSEPVSIEITTSEPGLVEITQTPPEDFGISLVGPQGPTGPTGPAGQGLASGGTTGQVLKKASATNYDTVWADPSGGNLASLTDVNLSVAPTNGQALVYDTSSSKWKAGSVSSSATDFKCSLYQTVGQTIPSGTLTTLSWDGEAWDPQNMHNSTNPTRITIPAGGDGDYYINTAVSWNTNGGQIQTRFKKNGTLIRIQANLGGGTAAGPTGAVLPLSEVVPLVAGDYIEVDVYLTAGTQAINGGITGGTFFQVKRLTGGSVAASAPGALIGKQVYMPGSATNPAYTATTFADVDATNAAVTFTVPTTGAVVVRTAVGAIVSSSSILGLNYRIGSTDQAATQGRWAGTLDAGIVLDRVISGLTPGATVTVKLGAARILGTGGASLYYGADGGPLTMTVWAA